MRPGKTRFHYQHHSSRHQDNQRHHHHHARAADDEEDKRDNEDVFLSPGRKRVRSHKCTLLGSPTSSLGSTSLLHMSETLSILGDEQTSIIIASSPRHKSSSRSISKKKRNQKAHYGPVKYRADSSK
jgi:hypothetical protein